MQPARATRAWPPRPAGDNTILKRLQMCGQTPGETKPAKASPTNTHTHTHTGGRSLGNALLSAAYRLICGGIVKRCRSDGKASVAQQQQGVPVGQAVLAWLECCQQQGPANNNRSLGNALPMTYEARGKALSNDRRSFAGPCRPSQPAVVDKAVPRTAGIRSWLGTLCLACKPPACTISSLVGLPTTQMASRISLARRPALWQGKPWNELVARDNTNPCNNPFVAMRCCNGPAAAMAGQGSADADRTSLGRQSRRCCPSPRSIERPHRHRRPPGPRGKASSTRTQYYEKRPTHVQNGSRTTVQRRMTMCIVVYRSSIALFCNVEPDGLATCTPETHVRPLGASEGDSSFSWPAHTAQRPLLQVPGVSHGRASSGYVCSVAACSGKHTGRQCPPHHHTGQLVTRCQGCNGRAPGRIPTI